MLEHWDTTVDILILGPTWCTLPLISRQSYGQCNSQITTDHCTSPVQLLTVTCTWSWFRSYNNQRSGRWWHYVDVGSTRSDSWYLDILQSPEGTKDAHDLFWPLCNKLTNRPEVTTKQWCQVEYEHNPNESFCKLFLWLTDSLSE